MKQLPLDRDNLEKLVILGRFNGWEPYEALKKVLLTNGIARVYLVATSCGMQFPKRTSAKLRKYAMQNRGVTYTELQHDTWSGTGRRSVTRTPALTALVKTPEAFAALWTSAVQVRSSGCGCSVFISDGQETDVRVMPKNSIPYGASQTYLPDREIYEGKLDVRQVAH